MANLTMTDLFCGAGGSTTGATTVPGITVRLAANHWARAIETHNRNYPNVDHLQADISLTDPRYVPHTDLLWASPECTNHSRAKGQKNWTQPDLFGETLTEDAVLRSRATMWDVVRFTEVHRYRAIVVENVIEVTDWGDAQTCRGGLFQAWLMAMTNLGYHHRLLSLNSMHAQAHGLPAPQSRDRLYVVFWRHGTPTPDLESVVRPLAWCPSCDQIVEAVQSWKRPERDRPGRYRAQYVYRCPDHRCRGQIVEPAWLPAASIIDWTDLGVRIGDREKPLADKTMARIQAGIDRYWGPLVIEAAGQTWDSASSGRGSYLRAWPTDQPLRTIHGTLSKGLVVPVEGREGKQSASTDHPFRTMTTRNETGLAMLMSYYGRLDACSDITGPVPTVTAQGNRFALVTRDQTQPAILVPYYGNGNSSNIGSPVPTVTTKDRFALIMRNQSAPDPGYLSTPPSEPMRTALAQVISHFSPKIRHNLSTLRTCDSGCSNQMRSSEPWHSQMNTNSWGRAESRFASPGMRSPHPQQETSSPPSTRPSPGRRHECICYASSLGWEPCRMGTLATTGPCFRLSTEGAGAVCRLRTPDVTRDLDRTCLHSGLCRRRGDCTSAFRVNPEGDPVHVVWIHHC